MPDIVCLCGVSCLSVHIVEWVEGLGRTGEEETSRAFQWCCHQVAAPSWSRGQFNDWTGLQLDVAVLVAYCTKSASTRLGNQAQSSVVYYMENNLNPLM